MCDHANPAGSRFCNACGAPVHLIECIHCGAVNDRASAACYKCAHPPAGEPAPAPLPDETTPTTTPTSAPPTIVPTTAEPIACEPFPGESVTADREGASPSQGPLHYVGGLTAPTDEAELDVADALVQTEALRGRRLGWAIAALLVMPSMIAATVYALEHRTTLERFVAYARALVPVPVGSAPSAQQEGVAPATSLDAAASRPYPMSAGASTPSQESPRQDGSDGSLRAAGERDSTTR